MSRLIFLMALFIFSPVANAWIVPLDPQNRAHGGLTLTDHAMAPGFAVGLDSRMTRMIFVDVGGFGTLVPPDEVNIDEVEEADLIRMRHGLTVTPGLRIPHRYGPGINWDLTIRAGFGAVWATDASAEYATQVDPALISGADLLVRKGAIGIRPSARLFAFNPFTKRNKEEVPMVRPQYTVEMVFQW